MRNTTLLEHIKHRIVIERACISLLEAGKRVNGSLSIMALHEIEQHRYAMDVLQKLMAGASTGDTEGRSEQPCSATEGRTATDPAANRQSGACGSHENSGLQNALPIIGRWNGEGPMPHRWTDDSGAIHYRSYEDYCFDGESE